MRLPARPPSPQRSKRFMVSFLRSSGVAGHSGLAHFDRRHRARQKEDRNREVQPAQVQHATLVTIVAMVSGPYAVCADRSSEHERPVRVGRYRSEASTETELS
eukprot:1421648-Pleurochrysis_carterae.AAC.1